MGAITQEQAAGDALAVMIEFLGLSDHVDFDARDRDCLWADLDRIAAMVTQMDAGKRGRGVSFGELPHVLVRVAVSAMRLRMSGLLDSMGEGTR